MGNPFAGRIGVAGPVNGIQAVTPNDSTDLSDVGVGIFTVAGGDIKFDDAAGNTHTITFPAWSGIDCGIKRVYATGTTAPGIFVGVMQ